MVVKADPSAALVSDLSGVQPSAGYEQTEMDTGKDYAESIGVPRFGESFTRLDDD